MTVQTAAGSKIFIGPVAGASVDTQGEYEALSYTEIGEVENLGDFGDQANDVPFTTLGDRRTRHFKGSFDAGTVELTVGFDGADAGQAAVKAALASDSDFAFKVTLADDSDGSPAAPTTFYWRGKLMGRRIQVGNAENVVRAALTIGINSALVEVAAV